MKKTFQILSLGLLAAALSSCCGLRCDDHYVEQKVVKYRTETRLVDPGTKGGVPYEVQEEVPYEDVVRVRAKGTRCLSTYCATTGRCGVVSKQVLRRATAQGGTGEPHMGQIPTMKVLAE